MCELCWGERRRPVGGDDPSALNCQLHHLLHCVRGWMLLSDAGPIWKNTQICIKMVTGVLLHSFRK